MHSQRITPLKQGNHPSFSSTLLDQIYRSIDHDHPSPPLKDYWAGGKALDSRLQASGRCFLLDLDIDHYPVYFSSSSISSDSSNGGFSSSDPDSFHGGRVKSSCFKLRPVKTHSVRVVDKEGIGSSGGGALFGDGDGEECAVTKSRALRVYETLKKVRQQPVSAGGRFRNILGSIFTSSSKKKGRAKDEGSFDRKSKLAQGQISSCSSATSFSRDRQLNGSFSSRSASAPTRKDLRDGAGTQSVRLSPINAVVVEDHPRRLHCRTFQRIDAEVGIHHGSSRTRIPAKNLAELKKKWEDERNWVHQTRWLEDIARRNRGTLKDADDDEDDAGSCSSSDLFEIDHLAMFRDGRDRAALSPVPGPNHGNKSHAVCKKPGM